MISSNTHIKSIPKTFKILEVMEEQTEIGVTELSQQTGISKSSIYKYLDTLRSIGYVTKNGSRYSLSLRFLQFGQRVRNQHDIYHIARLELDLLAEKIGETVSLVVGEDNYAVYLYLTHVGDQSRVARNEGDRIPIYHSAGGKALLAFRPSTEVDNLFDSSEIEIDQPNLLTDLEKARDNRLVIEQSATDGSDYSAGKLEGHRHTTGQAQSSEGSCEIAVPIRNADDYAIAAIEVSGSKSSLNSQRLEEEITPLLVSAGKSLEIELLKQ